MCMLFILDAKVKTNSKKFFKSSFSIALFIIALIHLVSFFNSENHLSYLDEIKNKIPFLFIPISLLTVEKVDEKKIQFIFIFFISCCVISSVYSYYHYRIDLANNLELYSKGEVMKTIVHHIYYSVLCSIGCIFCVEILFKTTSNFIKLALGIVLFWLYVFIHVMSVRTGIFSVYFLILLYIFLHFISTRKYMYLAGFIGLIIVIGFMLFEKIPTIKNKIDYTKYSFEQLKNNTDSLNNYSDPRRILSDKLGIEIIQKNKLVGVGIGDVQDELNTIYKTRYPNFSSAVYARIHNQYLETTASLGLPLGIVFIICLMFPLFYFVRKKDHLFITIYSSILVVMCWEPFLKTQIGTSIFLIISCIGFNRNRES